MSVESLVSLADERTVEPSGVDSRLVARDEQDGLARRVESKRYTPFPICSAEPNLLHVLRNVAGLEG